MDQTTTISSRRKTFTVPAEVISVRRGAFSNQNQTYRADVTGIFEESMPDINNSTKSFISTFENSSQHENNAAVHSTALDLSSIDKPEKQKVENYLKALVTLRNLPSIVDGVCLRTEGAGEILGENISVDLKYMRRQEKSLREEIEELDNSLTVASKICATELAKYEKKIDRLQKKAEVNTKSTREARNQLALMKKETKCYVEMALDITDRNDYPKQIIEKFLNKLSFVS